MDLLRRVFAAPARTYFNFGNPILVMGLSQISIRDTKIIACFTGRERPESLDLMGCKRVLGERLQRRRKILRKAQEVLM